MHLTYSTGFLCRWQTVGQYKTAVYPYTNCVKHVDCSLCLVTLDEMTDKGEAFVRDDIGVVIYKEFCGHTYNVNTFIEYLNGEDEKTFDKDDLSEINENTGIHVHEISRLLKEHNFRIVPPKNAEKTKYEFKSGGTFGFHGLK